VVVDCHAHVAPELTGSRKPLRHGRVMHKGRAVQWLPPSFDPPASHPETLLAYMDEIGIAHAYLVQHYGWGDQNMAILRAVQQWPDRFTGFAFLPSIGGPDAADQLERLIDAGMAGLKIELGLTRQMWPGFRLDGVNECGIWDRLAHLQGPLMLDANAGTPADTKAVRWMVDQFPTLRISICHAGGPPASSWRERALLGGHPRVWLDLSGLPGMCCPGEEYPYPAAQHVVRWVAETLGVTRVMWGTDYPTVLRYGTYQQHLDYVRTHCAFLTADQKTAVFGGAARDFLGGPSRPV